MFFFIQIQSTSVNWIPFNRTQIDKEQNYQPQTWLLVNLTIQIVGHYSLEQIADRDFYAQKLRRGTFMCHQLCAGTFRHLDFYWKKFFSNFFSNFIQKKFFLKKIFFVLNTFFSIEQCFNFFSKTFFFFQIKAFSKNKKTFLQTKFYYN